MGEKTITIVHGSPYEQGVQQGQALVDLIADNIKTLRENVEKCGCNMERYVLFMDKNAAFLQRECPDQIEEIKGIADGSGMKYEDILFINIPTYFMLQYFSQECSMILARGKATADGETYLIKNRDMRIPLQQVVIERHYDNGKIISEVNGAGIITYPGIGINSDGLALTTTGFWSKKAHIELDEVEKRHIFVNIHLPLTRCRSVMEVIAHLENLPRMNGLNIIAVDKDDAALIETTRNDMTVVHDDGSGIMFRTNHYLFEKNVCLNPDFSEYPSTFMRFKRINELLAQRLGKIRFQDLFRILSDHENEPVNSICRHPNALSVVETVSTTLVELEDKELWTTLDNPCLCLRRSCLF